MGIFFNRVKIIMLLIMMCFLTACSPSAEERFNTAISENNIDVAIEIFNTELSQKEDADIFNVTFENIINDIVLQWSEQTINYNIALQKIEQIKSVDNEYIINLATEKINFLIIEDTGSNLYNDALEQYSTDSFSKAMATIQGVCSNYSQYESVQELYQSCKNAVLYIVENPSSIDDYQKKIEYLDTCLKDIDEPAFISRKIQLEKELAVLKDIEKIVNDAQVLYSEGKYKQSFLKLEEGIKKYPDSETIVDTLENSQNLYIITITKQANALCEGKEYKEALNLVEDAIQEYDCEAFDNLILSIKEQSKLLNILKTTVKEKFEIIAQGWEKEKVKVIDAGKATGAYVVKSGKVLMLGDYANEDVTILSTTGNVVAAICNVDWILDARDLSYDITHWGEDEYFAVKLAVDTVALIPVIGAIKYLDYYKVADEIKDVSNLIDTTADLSKKSNNLIDNANDFIKGVKESDSITETIADNTKKVEKLSVVDKAKLVFKPYTEIKTINSALVGQTHPVTGIKFVRKKITLSDGTKIAGVFPQFDSIFELKINENLYKSTFKEQQDYLNKELLKVQFTRDYTG